MSSGNWKSFFIAAGIQSSVADEYVLLFQKNRMRFDMVEDLTTEILKQMGIHAMGDVIAITKQAERVVKEQQTSRLYKVPITGPGNGNVISSTSNSTKQPQQPKSTTITLMDIDDEPVRNPQVNTEPIVRPSRLTSVQAVSLRKMFAPQNTVSFKNTDKQSAAQSNKITTSMLNRINKSPNIVELKPGNSNANVKSSFRELKPSKNNSTSTLQTVQSRLNFNNSSNSVKSKSSTGLSRLNRMDNDSMSRNMSKKQSIQSRLGTRPVKDSVFDRLGRKNGNSNQRQNSVFNRLG